MKLVYLILSAIKVFFNMVQSVILSLHMGNLYLFQKKKKKRWRLVNSLSYAFWKTSGKLNFKSFNCSSKYYT